MGLTVDRQTVIDYIEERHLPDGGYFFARVEPSSGSDTCLAVITLRLLGTFPRDPRSIAEFWKRRVAENTLDDLLAISFGVETFIQVGLSLDIFDRFRSLISNECKKAADSGYHDLEALARLVQLARNMRIEIDRSKLAQVVSGLQRDDGSFGPDAKFSLSSAYHALKIFDLLSMPVHDPRGLSDIVLSNYMARDFLEDLFYFVGSTTLLSAALSDVNEIVDFVLSCRRGNGGFSRSRVTGIATIEHTFMAVKILKDCEEYARTPFFE